MEILGALVVGVIWGCIIGLLLSQKRIKRVNQRWKLASQILEKADVDRLIGHELFKEDPEQPKMGSLKSSPQKKYESKLSQHQLSLLNFKDRRDLEIERAKMGLSPHDNLSGMPGFAVAQVEMARLKHAKS
jgi:hypothetical protein